MGYNGLATAYTFRHLVLTAMQEIMKVSHEIIQCQLAHFFSNKIRNSYDKN